MATTCCGSVFLKMSSDDNVGERGHSERANWAEARSPEVGSWQVTSVHNNHNMDDLRRQRLASLLKHPLELLQSALRHQHGIRVETSVKIKIKQKNPTTNCNWSRHTEFIDHWWAK